MRYFLLVLFLFPIIGRAQVDTTSLRLQLPTDSGWNSVEEGETFKVRISATGGSDNNYKFGFIADEVFNMKMDAVGNFRWAVDYDIVRPGQTSKGVDIVFFVANEAGEADTVSAEIIVTDKIEESVLTGPLSIKFPEHVGWHLLEEGDTLAFQLSVLSGQQTLPNVNFYLEGDKGTGIILDSLNNFTWIPSFDYVDRLQQTRDVHIVFIAEDAAGNTITKKVEFTVFHKNRPPVIKRLPIIYVLQNTNNVYQLSGNNVEDPDGDPVVVKVNPELLPQGASISSKGVFQWKPSRRQFRSLLNEPIKIDFFIEDQPYKSRTQGELIVMPSQKDMPPEIAVIPTDSVFEIDEDKFLNINFYLSDPNGDDDIPTFSFVSDDIRIPKEALRQNIAMQYEFVWQPGYDFVMEPDEFADVTLRFFAIDRSQQSSERVVHVRVNDVENLDAVDEENYNMYHAMLVTTMDVIDHLIENQKKLEKEMRKAKKGKKNRAIMTASFGAVTGLSPLLLDDDPQKAVSAVGGTTVLTMGTLEAKDAVGTSINEVQNRLKVNVTLKNKLLNEGNAFARRYNTRSSRRGENFVLDVDRLKTVLNDPDFIKLELDPQWENPSKPTIRRLTKTFIDFKPYASE